MDRQLWMKKVKVGNVEYRFRKGRDINLGQPAPRTPAVLPVVQSVGLLAQDYPGAVFELQVEDGERVRRGQTLCVDRFRPEIAFVASVAGRVSHLHRGARRRIEVLEIAAEGDDETQFPVEPAQTDASTLRALLLASGSWVAFRTRPFGRVPAPSDVPSAICVTATDTNPLAPEPTQVLAQHLGDFTRGAEALLRLTAGPVFVCQAPGPPLVQGSERLRVERFSGPHPAGLAGTHIHHLWPVSSQRTIWQIGYQDVAAIGSLLSNGRVSARRTLSVGGPGLKETALAQAPLGANLADVVSGLKATVEISATQLISGSILSGRDARFLGRYDLQLTVQERHRRPTRTRPWLDRILNRLSREAIGATVPSEDFESLFPLDLLPVPLMRALAVLDVENTERLGGLQLLEEDLALLSWRCPSGSDYGKLLRLVMDQLAEERAA